MDDLTFDNWQVLLERVSNIHENFRKKISPYYLLFKKLIEVLKLYLEVLFLNYLNNCVDL